VRRFLWAVVVLAVAIPGCSGDASDTSTTDQISTTIDPNMALEAEFMSEIGSLAAALDSGDVESYLELLQPSLTDAERERAAFIAVSAPMHVLLEECEVLSLSGFSSEAACPVEILEPVRLEFGPAEGALPVLRYSDGLSPTSDGTIDPHQYTGSSLAYAAYLQQFMPDEYAAACDPAGYDEEIRYEYGVSLTRKCGELLASVAEDAAQWVREDAPQWVRDGKPAP
jgi:hypothetical protein